VLHANVLVQQVQLIGFPFRFIECIGKSAFKSLGCDAWRS